MTQQEFEDRFEQLWRERYARYDPARDHWTQQRPDEVARSACRALLLDYVREVQSVGIARRSKNRAQRLFDEMGIDPRDLRLDEDSPAAPADQRASAPNAGRILYVERKAGCLTGEARIGRVTTSHTGRTLYYRGLSFRSLNGAGFKANYVCVESGEEYWISGCKRDGRDRLYGERVPIYIDDDVRETYWTELRRRPDLIDRTLA